MTKQSFYDYCRRLLKSYFGWVGVVTTVLTVVEEILDFTPAFLRPVLWFTDPLLAPLLVVGWIVAGYQVYQGVSEEKRTKEHQLHDLLASREQELTEEISRLRTRIQVLEDRRPRMEVGFLRQDSVAQELILSLYPLPPFPDIEALVSEQKRQLMEKLDGLPAAGDPPRGSRKSVRYIEWAMVGGQREGYLGRIDIYLDSYRKFLMNSYRYKVSKDRLRPIYLAVANEGPAVAEEVEMRLFIPHPIELPTEEDIGWLEDEEGIYAPQPPEPPEKPSPFPSFRWENLAPRLFPTFAAVENQAYRKVRGPRFETADSETVVVYNIRSLNPGYIEKDLEPVILWFGSVRQDEVVEVRTQVFASTLPTPQHGVLRLRLHISR